MQRVEAFPNSLRAGGRAEHGSASTKEELSGTSESSADEIGDPVEPLVGPFSGEESGSKGASGVESTTRDGATNECEETKGEADSDGSKTGLGVSGSGVDGELLAFAGLTASLLWRGGLDRIERSSEDDVDEDVCEDEFHQKHLSQRYIVWSAECDAHRRRLTRYVGGEDNPE